MTNHLVAGRLLPDHVAGHLALELCNTKALWGLPTEREYLTDFTAVALWAREHGVLTAAETRLARGAGLTAGQRRVALGQVREMRAALFRAVRTSGQSQQDALETLHGFVARATSRSQYRPADRALTLTVPFGATVVVDRLALAVHDLLVRYGPEAVGLCASEACGWVFLDPSHRRRWCSNAVCGNRAKVRRFAERRRGIIATSPRSGLDPEH
jgi:predicted RNA-binding Zn ribbon-like protein